jgi:hypothetical protein
MVAIGLVKDIGPKKSDASREADRQKLRETINQLQPFHGQPRTFGQLCQHYIENELRIDQSKSARPKEFPTIETYERHLIKRIIPRWGSLAPLAIKSTEVEKLTLRVRHSNYDRPFDETAVSSKVALPLLGSLSISTYCATTELGVMPSKNTRYSFEKPSI